MSLKKKKNSFWLVKKFVKRNSKFFFSFIEYDNIKWFNKQKKDKIRHCVCVRKKSSSMCFAPILGKSEGIGLITYLI